MSIAINNKALRSLKADVFNENALQDYVLCIKVAYESVSFCAFEQYSNECQFFESYHLGSYNQDIIPLKEVQQIIHSSGLLSKQEWKKVILVISDRKCTLVPSLVANQSVEYHRLNCEFDPQTEELLQYTYESLQLTGIFTIQKSLKAWLSDTYTSTTIEYIHANLGFLKGVSSLASIAASNTIFSFIETGRIVFLELKNNKLNLLNSFSCSGPEDALYYSLFVMNELGITPKRAEITCWGDIEENDNTYSLLKQYINSITLGKRPMDLNFSDEFKEIPQTIEFDLFSAYNLMKR